MRRLPSAPTASRPIRSLGGHRAADYDRTRQIVEVRRGSDYVRVDMVRRVVEVQDRFGSVTVPLDGQE